MGAQLVAALTLLALLGGCASLPSAKRDPRDPWERFNRSIWTFDYAFDRTIYRPVAHGYVRVTPAPVRHSMRNFMDNLFYPRTIINQFLQGRFREGGSDIGRLLVNTLFGFGGLLDPATHMNLDKHDADFGQTLGIWGVPSGPFLMAPFYGPLDARDSVGAVADEYAMPLPYIGNNNQWYLFWGPWLVEKIDARSNLLSQDHFIDSAYDPYAFVRNAYLQHRDFLVHGNQTETPEEVPNELPEPTPGGTDNGNATPPPPPTR
jgi:phospholipid-binding lipoprotein MlaA